MTKAENISEYVSEIIRRDNELTEAERPGGLKAALDCAFAAPESDYVSLGGEAVITRNCRG